MPKVVGMTRKLLSIARSAHLESPHSLNALPVAMADALPVAMAMAPVSRGIETILNTFRAECPS